MRAELSRVMRMSRRSPAPLRPFPCPTPQLDAVVCAQAFHWFATREALAEIRRVLQPGGMLGLIWNVRDETVPGSPR